MRDDATPALAIEDLVVEFETAGGPIRAVDGASYAVKAGEILAIVGESGCGKTVTATAAMRLVRPPGRLIAGAVRLRGRDILDLPEADMRRLRGPGMAMIFQEPMSALNPVLTVGWQLTEALAAHHRKPAVDLRRMAAAALDEVGIADSERRLRQYPHELSGGLRQRVAIAMAIACRPRVLFADEPTTALDVTIQAQILDLIRDLARRHSMAVVFITHDFGVVGELADKVAVMYGGRVVEQGAVGQILSAPLHPYTRALVAAKPNLSTILAAPHQTRWTELPGAVQARRAAATTCVFADRCPDRVFGCDGPPPTLQGNAAEHRAACWRNIPEACA